MITTSEELHEVIHKARSTDAVAIDTEFVWTTTYYPKLGLIQLALSDEECYLIDPVATEDLSPLGDLLSDPRVIKIFHDAHQDLIILKDATGAIPKNIFDTRLAAGFAGMPATLSLATLVNDLLGISLPKTETRTDWLQRPLDAKQAEYAMDDVRYLRALRVLLISRIVGPEVKAWLQEELEILNDPRNYNGVKDSERYTKIRGTRGLPPENLAILRELAAWREQTARATDRPRGHVAKDAILLELTRVQPRTTEELRTQTSLTAKKRDRWGDEIIACITRALSLPEAEHPKIQDEMRMSRKTAATFERLKEFVQLKGRMLGIDTSLIGNTSEFKKLSRLLNDPASSEQLRQMTGWRKQYLHEFFHFAATQ